MYLHCKILSEKKMEKHVVLATIEQQKKNTTSVINTNKWQWSSQNLLMQRIKNVTKIYDVDLFADFLDY